MPQNINMIAKKGPEIKMNVMKMCKIFRDMEKRRSFKPEEKAKIVIEVLKEERTLNEIAAEYEIHPNQLSRWKT